MTTYNKSQSNRLQNLKPKNHFWRNMLTRAVLVAISVTLIVWCLPRTSGPQFRYDIGKPWMYSSLIANFDFAIHKSEETLKEEQDSVLKSFEPYYKYDESVEKTQINRFRTDFKNGIPGLSDDYVNIVADRLHRLYQAGIFSASDFVKYANDTAASVRVISGKAVSSLQVQCAYSTVSAYEQIFLDEKLSSEQQIIRQCNLNEYLRPNLIYDQSRTETEKADLLSSIPQACGMVLSGQKIVDRGEIVDERTYLELSSFEREMVRRSASSSTISSTIAGQILYVAIIVVLFTFYLGLFRKDYFEKPRSVTMLYVLITIFPIAVSAMMKHNIFSVYILPISMVPIFIRVFLDSRTAFVAHVAMVLICAAAVKYQYEFIIIEIVAGMTAIYSLRELSSRSQLFQTAFYITIGSIAIYFALQLMQDNSIQQMDHDMYKYFIANGVMLLFVYPLMLIVEKAFGFVSNVTLIELSNTSKDLLRRLSEVAPGTFQHSIMVGNLAAEIANKIGAKSQLVRTGALYHDIGKMYNPAFFTENQAGVNPLEKIKRTEAAQIVISHVSEGLKLAEKYNLPSVIKDFISTHHGLGRTKYFLISYKNEHPDEDVDETLFSYPGPNPFTREQAILMMADTIEAASRSLNEYTEQSISELVNRLIDAQVDDGFFNECPITFHDINVAKHVLIERLKNIYHTRIAYPELKNKGTASADE